MKKDGRKKTHLQKLISKKDFKEKIEKYEFSKIELKSINAIGEKYGINPTTTKSIIHFLEHQISDGSDWLQRIDELKSLKNTITERRYQILFGEEKGTEEWNRISSKKKHSGTIDFYIEKYGKKKGTVLWNEIADKKGESAFRESYWISKGFTKEEAKEKVSEVAKKGSKNANENQRLTRETNYEEWAKKMPTTIHFWMAQGFSEEEAKQKVTERQTTFSKDICIKKYGEEEGLKRWEERQEKWLKNFDRNSVAFGKASKESLKHFKPLIDKLRELNIMYLVGEDDNNELCIKVGKKRYFYDLTIPSLKLIFEYNGEAFHPNPNWKTTNPEKWSNWRHPFSKETSEERTAYETRKIQTAIAQGYEVIEIWSSENKYKNSKIMLEKMQQTQEKYFGV